MRLNTNEFLLVCSNVALYRPVAKLSLWIYGYWLLIFADRLSLRFCMINILPDNRKILLLIIQVILHELQ